MDDLSPHYDLIVTGTGLTQSIIAAATARVGKSVFHCDQNEYYSQEWQSMNFQQIINWCHSVNQSVDNNTTNTTNHSSLVTDGQLIKTCFRKSFIKNVFQISYLCDETTHEESGQSSDPNQEIAAVAEADPPQEDSLQKWSLLRFNLESRRFNLDLCPRLLFSRGSMVNLLVSSNISRYAEFKAITRILTQIDDYLMEVPVSRGDIFNSKDVSVVEKRMLMKFMMFCSAIDLNNQLFKDYEDLPINEYLDSQNLSPVLQKFILNAIAMTTEDCPTPKALQSINKFVESAGRFGNTPFLFTLYGTGELPQAFCRLCAVFGGTYCLKKKCDAIVVDQNNQCKGILIDGRRINCDFLVTDYSINNSAQSSSMEVKYISRAIIISDNSLKSSDSEQLSVLHIPKSSDNKSSVYIVEVGGSALVAPKGLFIQYLWCDSVSDNSKLDLLPVVKKLYNFTPETVDEKPKVLWSVYYNQECSKPDSSGLPQHVYTTTPPINELDFDFAINEARTIFASMFPNEEFLPRAPDPHEIVFFIQQNNDIEMNEPNNEMIAPVVNNENNENNH